MKPLFLDNPLRYTRAQRHRTDTVRDAYAGSHHRRHYLGRTLRNAGIVLVILGIVAATLALEAGLLYLIHQVFYATP